MEHQCDHECREQGRCPLDAYDMPSACQNSVCLWLLPACSGASSGMRFCIGKRWEHQIACEKSATTGLWQNTRWCQWPSFVLYRLFFCMRGPVRSLPLNHMLVQVMVSSRKLLPGFVRRPGCQLPLLTLGVVWHDLSSTKSFVDGTLSARREENVGIPALHADPLAS